MTATPDTDIRRPNRLRIAPVETIRSLDDEIAEWSRLIRAVPVDPRNQSGGGVQITARITGRAVAKERMDRAVAAIKANPNGRGVDIAKSCGMSPSYVNDLRCRLRKAGAL